MSLKSRVRSRLRSLSVAFQLLALTSVLVWVAAGTGFGQVSPAEILNPQLKALEQTHLPQLTALHRAIRSTKFPFPLVLSRYVGLDPLQQAATDTRGIEFVHFHERVLLKITGNYNATYNADLLTQNQRASRAFREVVVPILQLVSKEIPAQVGCDAVGFEISYHVRTRTRNSDYEGKEIVVVVLDREDAFGYPASASDQVQQEALNRSEIYVNGAEFGLALNAPEPLNVEALARSVSHRASAAETAPPATAGSGMRLTRINQDLLPGFRRADAPPAPGVTPGSVSARSLTSGGQPETPVAPAAATSADAERLQAQYQVQLDALAKEGTAKFRFADYAPPSFAVFQNRVVLQITLRNSLHFETDSSSIYKRAAQSFDLFLAPQLKAFLDKVPAGAEFAALDITLLNQLEAKPAGSSEALEFVFPLESLRRFVEAEITNQELINRSIVLVNGVRIALNLQLVE